MAVWFKRSENFIEIMWVTCEAIDVQLCKIRIKQLYAMFAALPSVCLEGNNYNPTHSQ